MKRYLYLAALLTFGTLPASAADFSDPTWPCVQRKVEALSEGLMWQYPLPETAAGPTLAADAARLGDALSLRRVALDDLAADAEAFAANYDGDPDALGRVFGHAFAALTKRRTRIINGIGDFSLKQIALAEQIDATRVEMDALLATAEPDFDKVDALEEKLDWDQVIFTDRQKSITYLCETPQLIEKRLFAIAQLLARFVVTR